MSLQARAVLATLAALLVVTGGLAVLVLNAGGASDFPDDTFAVADAAPSTGALPAETGARTQQQASRGGDRLQVDAAWVTKVAAAAGIPAPALRAYADAQLRLRTEQPGCHLGWNTLAGIGWIESQHGTLGGRTLLADGRSSTTILGPALDGSTFAAIRATPESTSWHGDPTWDHAVGPLQFLRSTWDRWGADGDGDGVADPRDLDDAALTAARYLCADGKDLATDSGWNAAVHSYNHDQTYVVNVANAANTYAQRAAQAG